MSNKNRLLPAPERAREMFPWLGDIQTIEITIVHTGSLNADSLIDPKPDEVAALAVLMAEIVK